MDEKRRVIRLKDKDLIKVIRCKDCKYYAKWEKAVNMGFCHEILGEGLGVSVKENFYCGYAKRKEENHEV